MERSVDRRDGYMLINFLSALQFISSIDSSCLSINPLDYQLYGRRGKVRNRLYATREEELQELNKKRLSLFSTVCYKQVNQG